MELEGPPLSASHQPPRKISAIVLVLEHANRHLQLSTNLRYALTGTSSITSALSGTLGTGTSSIASALSGTLEQELAV